VIVLDRSKNDASVALDFMRAAAAQIVCVGHALNFSFIGTSTLLPNFGVVLFFILSGFVIAATLTGKSSNPAYGPIDFGIERFARIYTAYLPALVFIAIADYAMAWVGHPLPGDSISLRTLLGNLVLRENLPGWPSVPTFGSAGQLSSVALEFHIYFLVGAVFFLVKARSILLCVIVIVLVWKIPASFAVGVPGTDRALFIVWLAGFAAFYIVAAAEHDRKLWLVALAGLVASSWWWARHRTEVDSELANLPALAAAFLSLMIVAKQQHMIPAKAAAVVRFFADYSYSLFLIHLTVVKLIYAMPIDRGIAIPLAILASNVLAIPFALVFEQRYRAVANAIKGQIAKLASR
jgi:peptidoglycan/LPS O-acetylase OafA/YrhL